MNGSAGIHAEGSDSHEHQHALQEDMSYEDEEDAFMSPRRQRQRSHTSSSTQAQRVRIEMKKMLERLKLLESRLVPRVDNDASRRIHSIHPEEQDEEDLEAPGPSEVLNGIEYSPTNNPSVTACVLEKSWSDFRTNKLTAKTTVQSKF